MTIELEMKPELFSFSHEGHDDDHVTSEPSFMTPSLQSLKAHSEFVSRMRKTLCYGNRQKAVASLSCDLDNDVQDMVDIIDYPSMPLTEVTVQLFRKSGPGSKGLEVFDMQFASSVSRKACISPCAIVMAMIYLERLKRTNPDYLRSVSPCDLFLVSMMVASKFLYDEGEEDEVLNDEWANSGGIETKALNKLEREFLEALDWMCFIDCDTFIKHLIKVEAAICLHQMNKRGKQTDLTYSELLTLMSWFRLNRGKNDAHSQLLSLMMEAFIKVMIISSIAYWIGVLTLLCSTSIVISIGLNPNVKYSSSLQLLSLPQSSNQCNNSIADISVERSKYDVGDENSGSSGKLVFHEEIMRDETEVSGVFEAYNPWPRIEVYRENRFIRIFHIFSKIYCRLNHVNHHANQYLEQDIDGFSKHWNQMSVVSRS